MAYKGKSVVVNSASHFITELKDFMVYCGWNLHGPSSGTGPADSKDEDGFILGWFLQSDGEDTNQDIHVHLGLNRDATVKDYANFDYLYDNGGGIDSSEQTIKLHDVSYANLSAGDVIRIEDELIQVGSVSVNSLLNCTRGYGNTSGASHTDNKVVQKVTGTSPSVEIYAMRDFTNPIASSSVDPTVGLITTPAVVGLGGYAQQPSDWKGYGRFDLMTLMEVQSTPKQFRWISAYTDNTTDGDLTTQKFLPPTPPGSNAVKIFPGGFLPAWTRREDMTRSSYFKAAPARWGGEFYYAAGMTVWFYGSKDGVFVVVKRGTQYAAYSVGNCITTSSPLTTTTTSGLSAGATTVPVTNDGIFFAGQKVRIMSQSASDWATNQDRSADVPAGSWHDLDAEEIPTEEVVVASVGTNQIILSTPLKYSYSAYALVGEDPRPAVRTHPLATMYTSSNMTGDAAIIESLVDCYGVAPIDKLSVSATFRQQARTFFKRNEPWNENPGTDSQQESKWGYLRFDSGLDPAGPYYDGDTAYNSNAQNDQLVMSRVVVYTDIIAGDEVESYETGNFNRSKGILPSVWSWQDTAPYSGDSEDTVKALWSSSFETFRVFNIAETSGKFWVICGPEIA